MIIFSVNFHTVGIIIFVFFKNYFCNYVSDVRGVNYFPIIIFHFFQHAE